MDNNFSFIEFTFSSPKTFIDVSKLFDYIKTKKQNDIQISNLEIDLKLMDFFGEKELDYFWWPTEQVNKEFWDKYIMLPLEERSVYLSQSGAWDYGTVFSEIGQGEYEIIGCKQVNENTGRFYYYPLAFPYGGAEPLVEAIR